MFANNQQYMLNMTNLIHLYLIFIECSTYKLRKWNKVYCEERLSIVMKAFKGGVNQATLSEPEFFVLFAILNVNMYISITNINHFTPGKLFPYNLLK